MTWRRAAVCLVAGVVVAGIVAPFLSADVFRARIQAAVEQGLHRKVQVGGVRFNLFRGPGFTLKDVTIYDDPSVGIEPLAYVESVQARVRLLSLLSKRLSISNLRLDEPSINLVKRDDGVWNFQLLLDRGRSPKEPPIDDAPSIQVRSGRFNFKFGEVKSTFYFSDTDVDLDPGVDRLNFRFRGEPDRTDRAAQNFGRLLFRGVWIRKQSAEPELDVDAELDRSAVDQAVKLIEGHGVGLHGIVASRAHIAGPLSKLAITGQLQLADIRRWDLMPPKGGNWNLKYRGSLDLWNQQLRLETLPDTSSLPLRVKFDASQYLSQPRWAVTVDLRDVPSATLLEVARHMGAPLPDSVTADGKVAGVIGYSGTTGLQGQLRFESTSLKLPSAEPITFQSADVLVESSRILVGPAVVQMPNGQTAELEGSYLLASGDLRMRMSTAGMDIAELHSGTGRVLGAGSLPVLDEFRQGSWKGWIGYFRTGNEPGAWQGELEVQNTRVDVPGMVEPVRMASGSLSVDGDKFALTRIRGHGGDVSFTGEFRSPRRLSVDIAAVTPDALERLFLPALSRRQSLLSRTLRLGRLSAPEWLRTRHVDATIKIGRLTIGGDDWTVNKARLVWDGTNVHLTGIDAHHDDASAIGAIQIDLSGERPVYSAQGRVENLGYKDGLLSVEGSASTEGLGAEVNASAQGEGTFTGEDISFAPDAGFETIAGNFVLSPGLRVKLTDVQISQGLDTYSGQGTTQPDGKLLLELTGARRQLRLLGTLLAPAPAIAR
jgi:AsmA family